jgi:hypothetical protein
MADHGSASALKVLLEQGPKHRLLDFTKFSTVTKRWTWLRSQGRLTPGDCHGFLLSKELRKKSAHSPSEINVLFYIPQNQAIRGENRKPWQKSVLAQVKDFYY